MKKILTSILLTGFALAAKSATFESTGATSGWNSATSWVVTTGTDADNIPDVDDDVTIKSGHNITMSTTSLAKSLVIELTATLNTNNQYLSLRGSFTNNGTITNKLYFILAYANITISSTSAMNIGYMNIVSATVTLPAANSIVGTGVTILVRSNSTFNNNGIVNVAGISRYGTTGNTWNNLSGSSLTFNGTTPATDIPTYNNSSNSTITMNLNSTIVYNITYHNLVLAGSGSTKTAGSNITINGNLTNNNGVTMNMANNTLNLKGNLSNSGTMSNLATVNFNGTTTQNINTTGSLSIANLNSASTSTVNLATGTYNVTASTALDGALTIAVPVTLNLNSNTLNLGGSLTNAGTISNLLDANFTGSTAQNISSTSSLTFDDIATSNAGTKTLTAGTYSVTNSIKVTNGTFNVGSSLMTLVSNSTKTAFIDVASSTGSISGTLIIQRNIDAQAANYHDLSSPTSNSNLSDWDEELYMSIGEPDNSPGYAGGDGMSGTDTSVFTYSETSGAWTGVTTAGATPLTAGSALYTYIADNLTSFPGRVIDTRGTPNMSDVLIPVTVGGVGAGWNLIGNPYAAHIDWNVARNLGANSAILESTNIQTLQAGNYADLAGELVPPGQGFFVYAQAAGSITIPKSSCLTLTTSNFDRVMPIKNYDIKLRFSSSVNPYYHEIKMAYTKDATNGFDKGKDVTFIKSPVKNAPSINFVDGSLRFTRNNISIDQNISTFPLELNAPIDGNYIIDIEGITENTEFDRAYISNTLTGEMFELSDANPVSLYLESKSVHTNYSLILSKSDKISDPSLAEDNISIFATSEFINIKGNGIKTTSVKVEVINLLGQTIINIDGEIMSNNTVTIPTENLNADVYVVKVTTAENKQISRKVVITK